MPLLLTEVTAINLIANNSLHETMIPASEKCQIDLLKQSLRDQLTQQQEEQLAAHLTECEHCRAKLETMACDADSWQFVSDVLRNETSGEHDSSHADSRNDSILIPRGPISPADELDIDDAHGLKPSDFIVDFLQPSQNKESLGRLGTIEIRQFIGQGAHGIVLKGHQEELNRLVAVKVMAPHLASVVAARKRFAREARATAAIVHPNVMPILQVDSSGQLPFLVMPYVDCESLQDRLDREGTLPLADVLRISLQVARGLAAAHAQGLVHRDVKPANILLERGVERVMLTDFGLARAVDDATLTRSGLIAGTPHYMSPEQARGDVVDTRSDLFSLGSVLYVMTIGRPPFRAESTYGILRRVTDETPRCMRELNSEIPAWFDAITMKLLAKSAPERWNSADQVAEILEGCLAHQQQPSIVQLPTVVSDLVPQTRRATTRNLRTAAFAAAAIALAATVFVLTQRPPEESSTDDSQTLVPSNLPESKEPQPTAEVTPWNDGLDTELQDLSSEIDTLLLDTETATSPASQ